MSHISLLQELGISFLVFTGLPAGILIAHFSKEEIEQGEKYFKAAKKILIIVMIFLLTMACLTVFSSPLNLVVVILLIGVGTAMIFNNFTAIPTWIEYTILGMFFFLAAATKAFLFLSSAMLFYAMLDASIEYQKYQETMSQGKSKKNRGAPLFSFLFHHVLLPRLPFFICLPLFLANL